MVTVDVEDGARLDAPLGAVDHPQNGAGVVRGDGEMQVALVGAVVEVLAAGAPVAADAPLGARNRRRSLLTCRRCLVESGIQPNIQAKQTAKDRCHELIF